MSTWGHFIGTDNLSHMITLTVFYDSIFNLNIIGSQLIPLISLVFLYTPKNIRNPLFFYVFRIIEKDQLHEIS